MKAQKLEFEHIHTKSGVNKYKAKITTKRNDSRLNNHQRLQLQGWRANCDIQVVIDYQACIEYLAKYASKGEPRSQVLKDVFSSIVRNCQEDTNPAKLIKTVIMKTLGQRDFSAQEVMHHLMSLKLISSSFNVIQISLNPSRKIKNKPKDGDNVTHDSLLDTYAKREKYSKTIPDIMNLILINFVTKYKVVNNKLTNQPENVIPTTLPVYSANPKGLNFGLYCKYQLLKYKPWQTTPNNAWGDQLGDNEMYINSWRDFLQTKFAKENVPDWHNKIDCIENWVEDVSKNDNEESLQGAPDKEEWMHLAELIPGRFVNEDTQNSNGMDVDWQTDKHGYTEQEIGEMPSWIKKKQAENLQCGLLPESIPDISTFSDMQRFAYDIINTHSEQLSPKDPLLLIIIGLGGTAKVTSSMPYKICSSCAVL